MCNKRQPLHTLAASTILSAGMLGHSVPLAAQALEEVVVVARKRVENLQDTPVAVSAFGDQDMREAQIRNLSDLSRQVPGLTNTDGAKFSGLTIRGVGARVAQAKVDPGVGVYVDGMFVPRGDTQLVDVVDMESIQVLRGPQGTLFGKNTAGGAILMSSKKPTEEFSGNANLTLGNFDRQDLSVRLSGPLFSDKLLGALTYDTRNSDGYMKDAITGWDYGDVDRQAVVGQFRYLPTDTLTIDFIALWGEQKEAAAPRTCNQVNSAATLQAFTAPASEETYADLCAESERLSRSEKVLMDPAPMSYDVTNNMAGLTIDWAIGDFQLKSITSYLKQKDLRRDSDQDATSIFSIAKFSETSRQLDGNGLNGSNENRRFISQEFNFFGSAFDDKLDYTLGLYASDEEIEDNVDGNTLALGGWMGIDDPANGTVSTLPPAAVGLRGVSLNSLPGESIAAFGQLIYYLNDMWQFTLGGRYTWEEKAIEADNWITTQQALGVIPREDFNELSDYIMPLARHPDLAKTDDKDDWTNFSPSITVTMFAPDSWTGGFIDSAMFYLTYSEGFKAGGFSDFGGLLVPFDPEEVANTEFGFKMDMFDSRVRLNAAIYSMDYDNMQLGVTRTFGEFNSEFGITNAGDAEVDGVELELSWLPLEGLLLSLTGSYIDAQYDEFIDEFTNAEGEVELTDRSEEPFAHLPENTWSWAAQYDWHTNIGTITPRISGYYKDEVYIGQEPAAFEFVDSGATLASSTVWDARIAYLPGGLDGLEIALYANNFTDEFYYGTGQLNARLVGGASLVRGKPRSYGIEFYYNW